MGTVDGLATRFTQVPLWVLLDSQMLAFTRSDRRAVRLARKARRWPESAAVLQEAAVVAMVM